MTILVAILGLAFLILAHEAGHFFASLAVGMRPRSFNLGFGPPLVKVTRNGIEYAVRALPLGGYVKIPGMHRPAPRDLDVALGAALEKDPSMVGAVERAKRPLAEGEYDQAAPVIDELQQRLEEIELPAHQAVLARRGLRELRDGLGPDAYWRQSTWRRIVAILAGPAVNILFGMALLAVVLSVGQVRATRTVDTVLAGHPAAKAGVRSGDTILGVDGRALPPEQISEHIRASRGKPIYLIVQRDGERLRVGPVRAVPDQGAYRIGITFGSTSYPVGEAAWQSVRGTGILTKDVFTRFAQLFREEERKNLHGAVGITQASSNALHQSVTDYLFVLALVSLSLGLVNLLPLLPFDGGHIVFSIVEGIRGRAVGREVYERASAVGAVLVVFIFVISLSNDIRGLGGG